MNAIYPTELAAAPPDDPPSVDISDAVTTAKAALVRERDNWARQINEAVFLLGEAFDCADMGNVGDAISFAKLAAKLETSALGESEYTEAVLEELRAYAE